MDEVVNRLVVDIQEKGQSLEVLGKWFLFLLNLHLLDTDDENDNERFRNE